MVAFADQIADVLAAEFEGSHVHDWCEDPVTHRVHGVLVWDGFDGQEPVDRQARLWRTLRDRVAAAELQRVGLVLTVTSLELRALMED